MNKSRLTRAIRRLLAWPRARWHADLVFQLDRERAALVAAVESRKSERSANDRIEHALAALGNRIDQLDQRLPETSQAVARRESARDEQEAKIEASRVESFEHISRCLQQFDQRSSGMNDQLVSLVEKIDRFQITAPVEPTVALPAPAAHRLTEKESRQLEDKGLFIVGSARSSTTILFNCLNCSDDVLILGEAFFFGCAVHAGAVGRDQYDFARVLNQRHVDYGNMPMKGTYLPVGKEADRTPFDFLNRMAPRYRYLGDKIAFGPFPEILGEGWETRFIEFHAKHFYHSTYFVTIRTPAEAIWSMHKLFPDRPIELLIECWLRSVRVALHMYSAFPKTFAVLHEHFNEGMIDRITTILDVTIDRLPRKVAPSQRKSDLADGAIPPVLEPYRDHCQRCQEIYDELKRRYDPETLEFSDAFYLHPLFGESGRLSIPAALAALDLPARDLLGAA